ncbi:MAG: Asp-tRNA(Asn)/Glu-tRNA(Gln) amidotransferase subunit GatC [Candidatus Aenigmarchaeota archaeon]|nr:Asp-tRNA(Asn)/Glu-tRNA(Gln) amidotransferase subunit GatC [Candidatus Aenigmarchaeota archaeon]
MIDKNTIERVAKLSRLNLTEEEIEQFSKDINNILEAFSVIKDVNTEGIEPSFQPLEVKNVFREDKPQESLNQEDALSNSKLKEKGFFKGPRAV